MGGLFLLPAKRKNPWLMIEAKSFWDKDLWQQYQDQVLGYLRNYALDIGTDSPVPWLILTNINEWHVLRLSDRQPFWSFSLEDFKRPEFVASFYERFALDMSAESVCLASIMNTPEKALGNSFCEI
ncbi:MAG: hypothetical protein R2865_07385 [Deinococcales bacterium]